VNPQGRIAVVTGAASGIGAGLVRALDRAGAKAVVATDVRPGAACRHLDVTDREATAALVDEIENTLGPVDIWFSNAGVGGGAGLETADAVWVRQWQVHVNAHVTAARVLVPRWQARGGGHLVITASMAGLLTNPGDAPYAVTKRAAIAFAEWLAVTHGRSGVGVSCVCPGAVDTPMLHGAPTSGAGQILTADEAALRIVNGVTAGTFLILTHPEMYDAVTAKAHDPQRWIASMQHRLAP